MADIHGVDARRAIGQQHIGEPAGRGAHVDRHRAPRVNREMRQTGGELDSAARNPGVLLAFDF